MIERYVVMWLHGTELGQSILAELPDVSPDDAVDAVFNLLNTGFLKIIGDRQGLTGIELGMPPEPPRMQIQRIRPQ